MKIRFTQRARRRVKLIAEWWREHRSSAPTVFDDELSELLDRLIDRPTMGLVYRMIDGEVVRRNLMPRSAQHVYCSFDEATDTIVIHTIWGARRGNGPTL